MLLELAGGNDSLNSFVPYAQPAYYRHRPKLAIPKKQLLTITPQLGLHPALKKLEPSWQAGDLALVQGLGYAQPNRSHFRSIDIWHTASDSEQYLSQGWLSQLLAPGQAGLQVIVLGNRIGPCQGGDLNFIALRNPRKWMKQEHPQWAGVESDNPALNHLLRVQARQYQAAEQLKQQIGNAPPFKAKFPSSALGRQFKLLATLLASGIRPPVLKLTQTGYDTHAGQLPRQQQLLTQLGDALAAFRSALVEADLWQQVTVMSYAEFGRRVSENGSAGTDHGTAATHLVLGGAVRGGLYGQMPSLETLEKGDMAYTTDFRRLYRSAGDWLGVAGESRLQRYVPLGLLG